MRTTGKKLICYTSRNRSLVKKENQSKPSSLNKDGCKLSYSRHRSFKPQSHPKKRRMMKHLPNDDPVETLQKISDCLSYKRRSCSKDLSKKTSSLVYSKNAACNGEIKRKRRKQKRKKKSIEQDEASRLQRRVRYLLIKMKLEQNLIDAYSGDGWKGQSREKIKPEKELQRAEKQILKCKLGLREAIHQLELLSSEGSIEDSVIYADGSVSHEHIFCAKCKSNEAFPDNDIILCDGSCNCGFHQKCLKPPLERIPPGDQGWLCNLCEYKVEFFGAINANLGTCFTVNTSWEDIFKEATRGPDVENRLNPTDEWPSEDSEDEDYYPERTENNNSRISSENTCGDASSSGALPSSSDEAGSYSNASEYHSWDERFNYVNQKSKSDHADSIINIGSSEASDNEIISRRQRRDVDYKKLHDEMFGKNPRKNEEESEDEDWGPKQKKIETSTGATTADCGDEVGCSNMIPNENFFPRKRLFRIPTEAVEKLRHVFEENELPSRAVRENLSKQLGISSEKITKWFRNARYAALKIRKAETTEQPHTNNVGKKRSRSPIKNRCSDNDDDDDSCLLPLSSIIRVPRNARRNLRKKQHERALDATSTDKVEKSRADLVENAIGPTHSQVSSKRRRRKIPLDFQSVSQADEEERFYLTEMERICNLEDKVRELKKALVSYEDNNGHVSNKSHSIDSRIIYVPVVVIKDKL